ncbi:hypothetical protein GGX14DRAFT_558713 [Mycena pura]|uniref:Uncharacterized protein n=1 Tax=Mycena pura TaxID=153505 RepID=A0AAD6YLD0_9AGAR|nr:hypothetical protein GGX14DRAFT_558713 [Mycena pura]
MAGLWQPAEFWEPAEFWKPAHEEVQIFFRMHWQSRKDHSQCYQGGRYFASTKLEQKEDGLEEAMEEVQASISPGFPGIPDTADAEIDRIMNMQAFDVPSLLANGYPGPPVQVVVFQDYKVLDEHLTKVLENKAPSKKQTLCILGSKGIGKSYSLYYLLIRRLHAGVSTIWSLGTKAYYFGTHNGRPVAYKANSDCPMPVDKWMDSEQSDPPLPKCVLVDFLPHGGLPTQWQLYPGLVVFASTTTTLSTLTLSDELLVLNPPTVSEIISAATYTQSLSDVPWSRLLLGIGECIAIFGPNPGLIFTLFDKHELNKSRMMGAQERMLLEIEASDWKTVLKPMLSTETPPLKQFANVPKEVFSILRKQEPWRHTVVFASRRMQEAVLNCAKELRTSYLLDRYQTMQDALMRQLWESFATDFLVMRLRTQYTFAEMRKSSRETESNEAFVEGPAFSPRISVPTSTVQISRWSYLTEAESLSHSISRSSSPSRSQSYDESAPGAKRKTNHQSEGPSQKKVKVRVETVETEVPQWERMTSEGAFTIENCEILYVPQSGMNPLYDAAGMAIDADGVKTGYLFDMHDRNGKGHKFMSLKGLEKALDLFPPNTPIVFVSVVPKGRMAKLMVPYDHHVFDKWSYYTLEILV